jgi:hypothetical protein
MRATYKGIDLGKQAKQYTVIEVSELVALYIKNHSDSEGAWIGSIQSALNEMFGEDGSYWVGRLREISRLIKYIGYRPGQDGNGNRIWRVPMEELMSGGVRVYKDIPTEVETQKGKKMATKDIPDGLRKNIQARKNTFFVCDICDRKVSELGRGPHMKNHYEYGEFGSIVFEAVKEYPGLTGPEYATLLGWKYSKLSSAMKMLVRKNVVEKNAGNGKTTYKIKSDEKKQIEEETPVVANGNGTTEEKAIKAATKPKPREQKNLVPSGVATITVIEAKDGTFYYVKDGKVYIVKLEEVSL